MAGRPEAGRQEEFPSGEGCSCRTLGPLQGMWWSRLLFRFLQTGQPNLGTESQEQLRTQSQESDRLSVCSAAHQPCDLGEVFWSPFASVFPSVNGVTAAHEDAVMLIWDDVYNWVAKWLVYSQNWVHIRREHRCKSSSKESIYNSHFKISPTRMFYTCLHAYSMFVCKYTNPCLYIMCMCTHV